MKKIGITSAILLSMLVCTGIVQAQGLPVQRDQQALSILSQTVQCVGGVDVLTSIQDMTGTGTATYYFDDPSTGNVTVKSRGWRQFKLEAYLSIGKRTVVVNGGGGSLSDENGGTWAIGPQSATDLGTLSFPYFALIASIQDSSIEITYGGLVTHNGASVHDVHIERTYTAQQDPSGTRGAKEAHEIYIDPQTFLVVAVSDQLYQSGLAGDSTSHEVLYSHYQSQNGLMMPMNISETMGGQTVVTLQLGQITFNTGLTDSDFQW